MRRPVVISTIGNWGGYVVTLVLWYLLTPLILRDLGAAAYGMLILAQSVVALGMLLDLGLGVAITRYVAHARARGEIAALNRLIAAAYRIYLVIAVAFTGGAVALAPLAAQVFDVPADQRETVTQLVVLAGVSVSVGLPASVVFSVLHGLQRFDIANVLSVAATVVLAAGSFAILALGGGVVALVAIGIPVTLAVQGPARWAVRRVAPEIRLGLRGGGRAEVREIAGFSWSVFLANASAEIQLRSDEVVIAAALPVSRLAPYAIARRLTTVPTQLAWQFAEVLLPVASALDGRDDDLRDLHVVGTRVTLGLFLPFACALGVLSERFIEAWIGPEYVSAASVLITIMLVAALLDAATWTGSQICQALLRHRPLAALAVAGTVLNLGLSIALVGPLGVTGVALATLIATSLESLLFVLPYSLRVTGVPARRMVREVMAPTACAAAATIGALAGLVALVDPRSTPALALVGAIGAVVYAAIHLSFAACAHERGLAATAWRRGLARVPGRGRED